MFGKNHVASTCLYTLISHNIETTNITRNTVVNVRGVGHIRQKVLGADVLEVKEMGKHKELSGHPVPCLWYNVHISRIVSPVDGWVRAPLSPGSSRTHYGKTASHQRQCDTPENISS